MRTRLRHRLFAPILCAWALTVVAPACADILYVGDETTQSIVRFDVDTGNLLDRLPFPASPPADAGDGSRSSTPRLGGIVVRDGRVYVTGRSSHRTHAGAVLVFDASTGQAVSTLVHAGNRNAPNAPQGLLVGEEILVADGRSADDDDTARILRYGFDGQYLGSRSIPLHRDGLRPIAMVQGPDGLLYVSLQSTGADRERGGRIVKLLPDGTVLPFITDTGGRNRLNQPAGLAFGPDGQLYVTSMRADPGDTDSIRIYDGGTGRYVDKIELYAAADALRDPRRRAFARTLVFGPGGLLYVPIAGPVNDLPNRRPSQRGYSTGEIRRYDVGSRQLNDVFVRSSDKGQPLGEPGFLVFGNSDSRTLAYVEAHPVLSLLRCFCADTTIIEFCPAVVNCDSGLAQDAVCGPACTGHGGELATACFAVDSATACGP